MTRQNDYTIRPRQPQRATFTTGAIDEDFVVADAGALQRIHISASSPASEDMVVKMLDSSSNVVASYTFDPSEEDDTSEITLAFEQWTLAEGGGTINITYANTGNTVSAIVVYYEYDAK